MKVSCLQENLARGLSLVGRAVSTRSTLPVLANVLLATDNGRLRLSATNLEISITCWIGAKVMEDGAITVPARTFNDLVSALPPERVELQLNPQTHTLHIACARTEANLKGLDAEEFPLLPEPSQEKRIRLETEALKQMISHVVFAAAGDDTRPVLTGVSTRLEDDNITLAATDGFRLSVRRAKLPAPVGESFSLIIPARTLAELSRVAGEEQESVYVTIPDGRSQIIFDLGNVLVVSQLVEGTFPDYSSVVPGSYKTRTVFNTAEFLKACKTADIFAREASHTARVRIEPGDEINPGHATISATSAETGDNVAQIDASVAGDAIEIAFNVKYMTEVLGVIDAPQVALETISPTHPGVIRPVGETDFTHVIMPMHFGR